MFEINESTMSESITGMKEQKSQDEAAVYIDSRRDSKEKQRAIIDANPWAEIVDITRMR